MLYDSIYSKYPDMQIHRNRKESNGWGEGNEKWENDCQWRSISFRDDENVLELVIMEAQCFKIYYNPPNYTLTEAELFF